MATKTFKVKTSFTEAEINVLLHLFLVGGVESLHTTEKKAYSAMSHKVMRMNEALLAKQQGITVS